MRIVNTKEMQEFFDRCLENINDDSINEFIDIIISKKEEKQIQQELHDINAVEFMGDENTWPSLYIKIDDYLKTPYHQNIHLDNVKVKGFEYREDEMPANELFNVGLVIDDPERELNDSLMLRAFDKPYKCVILEQDGEYWMSDTPQEANTIDPCAKKAHGNVLTFGLGIGYFVYMALLNDNVKSVTIVEKSESVIELFNKCLLPQFPKGKEIKIINGDAFDYYNSEFLSNYDYIFADIWKSSDDGFEMIMKMLESCPKHDNVDFWIEETCVEFITTMICMYFSYLANDLEIKHPDKFYSRIYRKIDTYFKKLDIEVSDVDTLKEYMYSKEVIRDILSIKVK